MIDTVTARLHHAHLDCAEYDGAICVLELWHDPLANVLCLLLVSGVIACKCTENGYPSPLCALIESDQELLEDGRVDDEEGVEALLDGRLVDVCECCNGVCDDL